METTNLNPNSKKVIKRAGKSHVFVTNMLTGCGYHQAYVQLEKAGRPVIVKKKAYDIFGKILPNNVAIFIEPESCKAVSEEADKIIAEHSQNLQ